MTIVNGLKGTAKSHPSSTELPSPKQFYEIPRQHGLRGNLGHSARVLVRFNESLNILSWKGPTGVTECNS